MHLRVTAVIACIITLSTVANSFGQLIIPIISERLAEAQGHWFCCCNNNELSGALDIAQDFGPFETFVADTSVNGVECDTVDNANLQASQTSSIFASSISGEGLVSGGVSSTTAFASLIFGPFMGNSRMTRSRLRVAFDVTEEATYSLSGQVTTASNNTEEHQPVHIIGRLQFTDLVNGVIVDEFFGNLPSSILHESKGVLAPGPYEVLIEVGFSGLWGSSIPEVISGNGTGTFLIDFEVQATGLCTGVDCSFLDDDCATGICNSVDGSCEQSMLGFAGLTCRQPVGECDSAESCNGVSPKCPQDQCLIAGTPCDNGGGQNSGVCDGGCICGKSGPVPTVSEWGLLAFSTLLAVGGVGVLSRRRVSA